MSAEVHEDIAVATVTATSETDPASPPFLTDLSVWARWFWDRWWLLPIVTTVIVPLRRSAHYCILDILLPLLAHVSSAHPHLRQTLRELRHFSKPVMALWGRAALPSQSQISRWLCRIDDNAVEAWRTLFCPMSAATVSPAHVSAESSGPTVDAR